MRRSLLAIAMLGLVALSSPPADAKTYSVVVGHNGVPPGVEGLRELQYADDDAARWADFLGRLGPVHLLTVLDADSQRAHPGLAGTALPPTADHLARAVASVRAALQADAAAGKQSQVFFVYSGHGAHTASGEPFLALHGGELHRDALYAQIAALPARYTHIVVDACHAAAIVGARGGFFDAEREAEHVDTTQVLDELARPPDLSAHPHVGVLLSAAAGESSHEWSEIRAGVFTHEVLSALMGPADINADGGIEYSEVAAYVAAANREVDDPRAVPTVVARPPALNARARLVDVAALGPALTGTATQLGRFSVETGTSVRYADGHLVGDYPVRIALPHGRSYLRIAAGEAVIEAPKQDVAVASLSAGSPRGTPRGSVDAAFRRGLFAATYGRDYYRGYVDAHGLIGAEIAPEPVVQPEIVSTAGAPRRRSVVPAVVLWSTAGAATAAGIVSTLAATRARRDFHATDIQREAFEAADRFDKNRNRAIAFYGIGLVTAVSGALIFPRQRATVSVGWGNDHGAFVSFSNSW